MVTPQAAFAAKRQAAPLMTLEPIAAAEGALPGKLYGPNCEPSPPRSSGRVHAEPARLRQAAPGGEMRLITRDHPTSSQPLPREDTLLAQLRPALCLSVRRVYFSTHERC